jgi:hypothetical protein
VSREVGDLAQHEVRIEGGKKSVSPSQRSREVFARRRRKSIRYVQSYHLTRRWVKRVSKGMS